MGLITSYSSANREVEQELAVKYTRTKVYGTWSYTSGTVTTTLYSAWSYTRSATKVYKYVGMTKTASDECANDMRTKYQRSTSVSEWSGTSTEFADVTGGSVPMADVLVSHVGGDMWEVIITVSESDSRMRMACVAPSMLFALEDARDYDTGA